ncbi:MAG: hypothetical protein GY795_32410 [Desulfobacterales bacterium]|nr:hypothetical protein [Desulfobacterales bacterium]
MKAFVNSETAPLRAVLLGFIDNFKLHEPINSVQHYYFKHNPPRHNLLLEQHAKFVEILDKFGIRIYQTGQEPDTLDRLFVRDLLAVVHDIVIVCFFKEKAQWEESTDISELSACVENPLLQVDSGIVEGGDIMLDKDILYVGLGERTDLKGLEWLKRKLGNEVEIQSLKLQPSFLHLDVVFNLLGKNIALVYPPALDETSLNILKKRYRLFEVSKDEQFSVGVNLFSLTPETVISEKGLKRINSFLRKEGLEVIETDYSEILKFGGSFRCSTSPLIRDRL